MKENKNLFKNGFSALKRNYFFIVFVCLLISILSIEFVDNTMLIQQNFFSNSTLDQNGNYLSNISIFFSFFNNDITNNINGILQNEINAVTYMISPILRIVKSITQIATSHFQQITIPLFVSAILLIIYNTLVKNALLIGFRKMLIENYRNNKLRFGTLFLVFRKKEYYKSVLTLLLMNVKLILWALTIVMFPIKYYEYKMIPFILAENPEIKTKEAFIISKETTKGYKLKLFLIDFIYFIAKIIGLFTLNISNILITAPLKAIIDTELYFEIKAEKIKNKNILKDVVNEFLTTTQNILVQTKEKVRYIDYDKKYTIIEYILFFFVFAFIGWIYEVILTIVQLGFFCNRGFLYGPILPIYGFGGVAVLILLRKILHKPIATFFSIMAIAATIEYSTSYIIEKITGLRYWDYSNVALNLNGRICLKALIVFGLAGCLAAYIVAPLLSIILKRINKNKLKIIACILIIILLFDFSYTIKNPHTGNGISTENTVILE